MTTRGYVMNKIPLDQVAVPKAGMRNVYLDQWWAVSEDECVYTFGIENRKYYDSPQTNRNKAIVERLTKKLNYPDFKEIRQIPFVSFPVNISDYV